MEIIMRDFFIFTMITKTRPWRYIYHDTWVPGPKNHDIKIPRPKDRDIKIWGLKYDNIETNKPRHFDFKTFFHRTRSHDIKIPRLNNHDIEIPRLKNHDIEIPRSKPWHQVPVEFWPLCALIVRPDSLFHRRMRKSYKGLTWSGFSFPWR